MKSGSTMDLTQGSITKQLLVFVFPILITNLVQQLYNAADAAVVGRFAGAISLAAVGSTGTATNMLLNIFVGLATGTNIICARLRGAGQQEELERAMHASVVLAALSGLVAAVLGLFLTRPMLQLMGLSENIIGEATVYMTVFLLGSPASLLFNFCAGILRAHGDAKHPMIILTTSGIINIALNLLFVIVFHLNSLGVALATVASQIYTAVAVLWILFNPKGEYKMELRRLTFSPSEFGKIAAVGVPCGLNGLVFSLSNMILQSAVFTFSDVVVAGSAASNKMTNILYVIISSFYSACVSFAGQCSGKGDQRRIDKLLIRAIALSAGFMAASDLLLTIFPTQVLAIFTTDADVAKAGAEQMLVIGWAYILYCVCEMTLACLRGMGKSAIPTLSNVVCICLPRVIWIFFIFPLHRTIPMLYLCYPISYVIASGGQLSYFLRCRKQNLRGRLAGEF